MKTINQPETKSKPTTPHYKKLAPMVAAGATVFAANSANAALDLSAALDGAELKGNIEIGILFVLGVVLILWGGKKVIGMFSR